MLLNTRAASDRPCWLPSCEPNQNGIHAWLIEPLLVLQEWPPLYHSPKIDPELDSLYMLALGLIAGEPASAGDGKDGKGKDKKADAKKAAAAPPPGAGDLPKTWDGTLEVFPQLFEMLTSAERTAEAEMLQAKYDAIWAKLHLPDHITCMRRHTIKKLLYRMADSMVDTAIQVRPRAVLCFLAAPYACVRDTIKVLTPSCWRTMGSCAFVRVVNQSSHSA